LRLSRKRNSNLIVIRVILKKHLPKNITAGRKLNQIEGGAENDSNADIAEIGRQYWC